MKSRESVAAKLASLEADERFKDKPALVDVNAPLALIQCEIRGKVEALKWVLR